MNRLHLLSMIVVILLAAGCGLVQIETGDKPLSPAMLTPSATPTPTLSPQVTNTLAPNALATVKAKGAELLEGAKDLGRSAATSAVGEIRTVATAFTKSGIPTIEAVITSGKGALDKLREETPTPTPTPPQPTPTPTPTATNTPAG